MNIGIGAGTLEAISLAKGVNIHSVDPSTRAIERLRTTLNLGDKARVGYAESIPFPPETFDVVVMSEVLEHLDDSNLDGAFREVRRTLKPDGFLLTTTPYRENLRDNRVVCPCCGKVFHRMGHVRSFDKPGLTELLTQHQYAIDRMFVTAFVDWRRKGVLNQIKSVARILLARLGEAMADPHLVALARKRST